MQAQILPDFAPLQDARVTTALYFFGLLTIKLAILLEFLRIFSPGRSNFTFWVYHTLIWLNLLLYVTVSFLTIFLCQPLEKYWKPWIDGRCLNGKRMNVVISCLNSASDLSLLIVPQRVICNLHMSFKRRFGVSAIFLAGIL